MGNTQDELADKQGLDEVEDRVWDGLIKEGDRWVSDRWVIRGG